MTEKEKSVPDLEKEKLEIEIELLKQNLEKEKKASKKHIYEGIRKYTTLSLAIASVIVAFITIIFPVKDYFEEKKKALIPKLNNEIIDLVDSLYSTKEKVQEKATVMLTYYGLDAVPVLLLKLEQTKNKSERDRLIQAIKNAYHKSPEGVMNEIYSAMWEEFEKYYIKYTPDEMHYIPKFYNYFKLLKDLDLSKGEKKDLKEQMEKFEEKIPGASSIKFRKKFLGDMNKLCRHYDMDTCKLIIQENNLPD